ncbi:hypothetical protein JCM11641_002222 [Rhodosporidiobolus odoratus]
MATTDPVTPPVITPQLSLTLRIRFLESLLISNPPRSPSPSVTSSHVPLTRRVARVQHQLDTALATASGGASAGTASSSSSGGSASEAIRRFVQNYDLNSPLLSVAPLPLSSPLCTGEEAPTSPQAKVALILEAEQEVKFLERDLRELAVLDERGVVGAGKLGEHEALKADLTALRSRTTPTASSYAALESRTTTLLQTYNNYISTLSELFVSWNDILTEAEEAVTTLEKQKAREGAYDVS